MMRVYIHTEIRHGRSGIEARAPGLRLTSHGPDAEAALQSLQRGIVAWCQGLESVGELESVLKRNQIRWERDGESIVVELEEQ